MDTSPTAGLRAGALLRSLRWLLLGAAALTLVAFVATVLARVGYPFELEWMEGGSLDHVRRLLSGRALYVRPTLEFVPFIYTPLYYYLCGLLGWLFGPSLQLLRAVSIASTCLTAIVVYAQVQHETRDRYAAFLAAALLIGTYRLTGYWFDVARADASCMLLLSVASYLVRCGRGRASAVAAAVVLTLAWLTKQVALPAALPLGGYLLLQQRARGGWFAGSFLLLSAAAFFALEQLHGGWFAYYTVLLPAQHAWLGELWPQFWLKDLRRLAPTGLLVLVTLLSGRSDPALQRFYGPLALTLFGVSWLARLHDGGDRNVIMPALLVAALVFGLIVHRSFALANERTPLERGAAYALCVSQLALLLFVPWQQVPSSEDRRIGRDFIARLRVVSGDVYVVDHGFYPALAGKRALAHGMAVADVVRGDAGPASRALSAEITQAVATRRFAAVVVGTVVGATGVDWRRGIQLNHPPAGFVEALERHYVATTFLYGDTTAFTPRVGWPRRPCVIYTPKPE